MPFVYSTAANSGTYVEYAPVEANVSRAQPRRVIRSVTIKGGTGVATRSLITPKGVATEVSQDELDFLLKNSSFQRHVKAGFLTYDQIYVDPAKKAESMTEKDNASPLTEKDLEGFAISDSSEGNTKIFKGRPKK